MNDIFHKNKKLSSAQIIIIGFAAVILLGAIILTLPFSTKDGQGAPFLDALFTSISATCVTGLVVHDTATYWSSFGQFIILCLIQIGGMGVVTVAVFIAMISGRKIGLMQRSTMQEAISAPTVGGIVKLTNFILKTTAFVELTGFVLLLFVFGPKFGPLKGTWYALFHSISAFCNAGFDLMGETALYSSLTSFSTHPLVNIVIIALIIIGGIGFSTWDDICTKGRHLKKYRMQSKVIFLTTAILLIIPALYFYFFEFSKPIWEFETQAERIWNSLFQAVTPRTAGFNTADLTLLTESGKSIMIVLMLTGGAPGSTAGGMKITTVAVLFLTAFSVFRRREDSQCFGRRIPEENVRYAATILLMYVVLFWFGGILISSIEGLPLLDCLFETASAIGTVGLSLGLTPGLGTVSHIILMILMFLGRVGGLTLVFAAISGVNVRSARLPQEKITVG